jgi:hypothetical protein
LAAILAEDDGFGEFQEYIACEEQYQQLESDGSEDAKSDEEKDEPIETTEHSFSFDFSEYTGQKPE